MGRQAKLISNPRHCWARLKETKKCASIWRKSSVKRVLHKEPSINSRKRRKGRFGSGNQDSSALPSFSPSQLLLRLTLYFIIPIYFSSFNIWTNKPLWFVCIKRVSWVDHEIMQKVDEMSVIMSRITVPPKSCSNTKQVSVWVKNCTTKYTQHTPVAGNDNNTSSNSLDLGFFHEWDFWGAAPAQPFQHSHYWKSKLGIITFRAGRALWSANKEETSTKALLVPSALHLNISF